MQIPRDLRGLPPIELSSNTALSVDLHANRTLICTGTHSHTHPTAVDIPGVRFRFFNAVGAVTTLLSTSSETFTSQSGVGTSYKMTDGGQYAETESDDANWMVIRAN